MNTPIIILNKNRLSTTEKLCDHLLLLGYDNITILDIASTYGPLMQYYLTCPAEVIMADDIGHKGLWNAGYIDRWSNYPWICVTDSDIELHPDTPKGFIEKMITVAKDYRVNKVGLAIEYKNISNPVLKQIITPIEQNYWKQRLFHDKYEVYNAPVDTTLCIVQPLMSFQYQALRIANWPIKHLDWYSDWNNLTEEELYYFEHCDPKVATTASHYNKWKREH
jgi:hypothetical protein